MTLERFDFLFFPSPYRFCNENKLRMGEGGYFFANLCCAVSFIENMTAESISMDPEEFESYISGRAVPPGSWRSSMLTCEGLQVMSQNVKTLTEVKNRYMVASITIFELKWKIHSCRLFLLTLKNISIFD